MIYIYGAGMLGKKYVNLLNEAGVAPAGFLDTYKKGEVTINERSYPIIEISEINKKEDIVTISILDINIRKEIEDKLAAEDIKIRAIKDLIYKDMSNEEKQRKIVGDYHVTQMDDYFENAESEEKLNIFWNEDSAFRKYFEQMKLDNVVELACGRGRHVKKYVEMAENIILVDYLEKNIELCKARFKNIDKISYHVNNGKDLKEITDESVSAIFSYDSMVHFELLDVYSYLEETCRILQEGGMALFHHSNNTENYQIDFTTGKYGRNYMSKQLFAHLAWRSGLEIVSQEIINWGGCKNLDCITLLQKGKI